MFFIYSVLGVFMFYYSAILGMPSCCCSAPQPERIGIKWCMIIGRERLCHCLLHHLHFDLDWWSLSSLGSEENPIEVFKDYLEQFREVWSLHSSETQGFKIKQAKLFDFYYDLKEPMGFDKYNPEHDRKTVAKAIMSMNLLGLHNNNNNIVVIILMRKGMDWAMCSSMSCSLGLSRGSMAILSSTRPMITSSNNNNNNNNNNQHLFILC